MKLIITIALLLFNAGLVSGQIFSYPAIQDTGEMAENFIPEGWELLKIAKGDLNNDTSRDVALVMQKTDSVNMIEKFQDFSDTVFAQPRILIIAFKDKATKNYKLVEQENSFIIPHSSSSMEEPFQIMEIDTGILKIGFHIFSNMGSWTTTKLTYNFKYQNPDFNLISAERYEFHRATHDFSCSHFDFIDREWNLKRGNDNADKEPIIRKDKLNIEGTKTLQSLERPQTWEVVKDIYI